MSGYPFGTRPRPSTTRPRRRVVRALVGLLLLGVVFAVGVALGRALDDHPRPGPSITYVRTLEPLPQQPVR